MIDHLRPELSQAYWQQLLEEARAVRRDALDRLRDLGSRFPNDLPADLLERLAGGGPDRPAGGPGGQEEVLRGLGEVTPAARRVEAAMAERGYPERDRFAVRLALEEALVNAVKHGNGNDPAKRVRLRWRLTPGWLMAEVEDEGKGFDPAAVPDPREPDGLGRPGGRGLLLMRHYLDGVSYNVRGNAVTLHKRRSDPAPAG